MNAVTCTQWIQRGVAKQRPDSVAVDEKELKDLIYTVKNASLSSSEEEADIDEIERKRKRPSKQPASPDEPTSVEQNVEEVDEKASDSDESNDEDGEEEMNPLALAGVAYYGSNKEDPNIIPDQEDSDEEDMHIMPEENLIVIGKVKKDFCSLEVFVHSEKGNNCWCHHDVILPTIPLCLEWLDFDSGEEKPGNMLAVGSVGPDIEIWDLDVVNSLEPAFTLAGAEPQGKSKSKKKRKSEVAGHTDAVLSLSWNKDFRHALASGSADQTVGLWDLSELKMIASIPHEGKVQSVQWQPSQPQSLLTGSTCGKVSLYDCSNLPPTAKTWQLDGEVEQVLWDARNPNYFLAATDVGTLFYFDVRMNTALFQCNAHKEGVSSIAQSILLPACIVTTGSDKYIRVWNIVKNEHAQVFSKKMNMGQLFSVSSCPDSPFLFAVAGEQEFRVLDLSKNPEIPQAFGLNNDKADGVKKSADIEIPIGHTDYIDNQSGNSSDEQEVEPSAASARELSAASANGVLTKTQKKRMKKKARRKLAENLSIGPEKENGETVQSMEDSAAASTEEPSVSDTSAKKKNKKKKKNKAVSGE